MDNIKWLLIALLLISSGANAGWTYGVYGPEHLAIAVGQPGPTQIGNSFDTLLQKPLSSTAGGQTFATFLNRAITPANLAKAGRIAARAVGPIGFGMLALSAIDAVWDEPTSKFMSPTKIDTSYSQGKWRSNWPGFYGSSPYDIAQRWPQIMGLTCTATNITKVNDGDFRFDCANYSNIQTILWSSCAQGTIYSMATLSCVSPGVHESSDDEIDLAIQNAIGEEITKAITVANGIKDTIGIDELESKSNPDTTMTGPTELPKKTETTTKTENGVETTEQTETQIKAEYDKDQANLKEEKKKTTCSGGTCTTTSSSTGGNQGGGNNGGGIDNGGGGGTGGDDTVTSIDFCITHPDRVGCIDVGDPATADIPLLTETRDISMTAELTANGQCPASIPINLHGVSTSLSFDGVCSLATGLRPIVILVAWLSSGIFVFQVARG